MIILLWEFRFFGKLFQAKLLVWGIGLYFKLQGDMDQKAAVKEIPGPADWRIKSLTLAFLEGHRCANDAAPHDPGTGHVLLIDWPGSNEATY